MTTGRINQVTTLAHRNSTRTVEIRRSAIARSVTDRTRSPCSSRVVFSQSTEPSATDRPARVRSCLSNDRQTVANLRAAFTVRLPDSRCETGILKTVEFLTNLDEPESIVPDCVHLSTTVLAGHARTAPRTCVSRPGTCNRATARYTKAKNLLPALRSSFRSPTPRLTYIRWYTVFHLVPVPCYCSE